MEQEVSITKLKNKKKNEKFEYKRSVGARMSDKDARVIGERAEYLIKKKRSDGITPEEIVRDAEKKSSPLHTYFEWDDDKAGHRWRVEQARKYLQGIVVSVTISGVEKDIRGFFSVKVKKDERAYVTFKKAIKKKKYRSQIIAEARMYIRHFDNLLGIIQEL